MTIPFMASPCTIDGFEDLKVASLIFQINILTLGTNNQMPDVKNDT